jgi:Cap4 SAVED domain
MTTSADAEGTGATPSTATRMTTSSERLAEALARLARGEQTDLAALLHNVEGHVVVDETNVTAHCHCLTLDGNGRPRIEALVEAVAEHVLDYAIPRNEYRVAKEDERRTGSSRMVVRLINRARQLFTDLEQSGEGGELLLFALAEKVLQLPQLICKMSLKTNTRMHIHGADGLHAGVDKETGKLLLYWGESKIHGDVTGAVRECLASLAPMLQDHEASKRDLQLLQRHLDIDDQSLENALKKFLNPDDPAFNSVEFRGLCLVGFDCDAYPKGPSKSELKSIVSAITAALPVWKKHVVKRVSEEKLDEFSMHFFFVPFPSADRFRELFREHLQLPVQPSRGRQEAPEYPVPDSAIARRPPVRATASPVSQRARDVKGNPRGAQ